MIIGRVLTVLALVALMGCERKGTLLPEIQTIVAPHTRYKDCVTEAVPFYAATASPSPQALAEGIVALCKEGAGLPSRIPGLTRPWRFDELLNPGGPVTREMIDEITRNLKGKD